MLVEMHVRRLAIDNCAAKRVLLTRDELCRRVLHVTVAVSRRRSLSRELLIGGPSATSRVVVASGRGDFAGAIQLLPLGAP